MPGQVMLDLLVQVTPAAECRPNIYKTQNLEGEMKQTSLTCTWANNPLPRQRHLSEAVRSQEPSAESGAV